MLSKFSHYFSRIRSGSVSLFVALMLITTLSACDPLTLAGKLVGGGGGPNVNANVGKEVTQGVDVDIKRDTAPRVSVAPRSRVDTIDQSTTNHVSIPPWVLLVIVCLAAGGAIGWVDNIVRLFRRKNHGG